MIAARFLVGLLVGLALAVRPGRTSDLAIRDAASRGAFSGLRAATGRAIADALALCLLAILALEHRELFTAGGSPAPWLEAAAAIGLLVLGWRIMGDGTPGALWHERGEKAADPVLGSVVSDRLAGALLDPAWHLFWWLAGLRLVLGASSDGWRGVFSLGVGLVIAGPLWYSLVAGRLGDSRRERAFSDRALRIFTSLGGLLLVGFGLGFGFAAITDTKLGDEMLRFLAGAFGREA
jgi:threonine/homoserine/homoserine lactone efflux protein